MLHSKNGHPKTNPNLSNNSSMVGNLIRPDQLNQIVLSYNPFSGKKQKPRRSSILYIPWLVGCWWCGLGGSCLRGQVPSLHPQALYNHHHPVQKGRNTLHPFTTIKRSAHHRQSSCWRWNVGDKVECQERDMEWRQRVSRPRRMAQGDERH